MARTVDLEALRRELEAEGLEVTTRITGSIECGGFSVWDDFEVMPPLRLTTAEFAILDIISRHVVPAPPVVLTERERDQLARAMHHHMHSISGTLNYDTMTEEMREYRRGSIDAVLVKLAELGIVLTREARP